jgi:hypothetical protein
MRNGMCLAKQLSIISLCVETDSQVLRNTIKNGFTNIVNLQPILAEILISMTYLGTSLLVISIVKVILALMLLLA